MKRHDSLKSFDIEATAGFPESINPTSSPIRSGDPMHGTLSLSRFLLDQGLISSEELQSAQEAVAGKKVSLPEYLIAQKRLDEQKYLTLLAEYFSIPFQDRLDGDSIDPSLIKEFSIHYLKKNKMIPLSRTNGDLTVAVSDPFTLDALNDLRLLFDNVRIKKILVPSRQILDGINRAYSESETGAEDIIQDLDQQDESFFSELSSAASEDLLDDASDAPIIKLVNHILAQAVKSRASDIHIEPYKSNLQVRFRMDGVLYNILDLSLKLHAALVSRIKIMAGLNIAEKRRPQDGRIEIKIGNRQVDLRVSTLPTAFGERVVLRLLEKGIRLMKLHEIGLSPDNLAQMKRLVQISHGIILVTGPTGSGKTSTLYSALNHINSPDRNILTIEDPIEYQLDGIGQMQVNSKIGLTFANGLRSMVRQDPDVILVGEIRDFETAEIAIQAALTGHLVFSTLHTNDAAGAVTRLIDMGVEPFLVSSAVRAIIAQRLVRTICTACTETIEPGPDELQELQLAGLPVPATLPRPAGCEECLKTGYRGRTGIYEFLILNEDLQSLILKTSDAHSIRKKAMSQGMPTLRDDGIRKVADGKTTMDEVLRVTQV
ncbi:MAG: type II secretion system ATPase GspE [Desulfovibrionales bacterium]